MIVVIVLTIEISLFARVSSFTITVYDLTRGNLLAFKGIQSAQNESTHFSKITGLGHVGIDTL